MQKCYIHKKKNYYRKTRKIKNKILIQKNLNILVPCASFNLYYFLKTIMFCYDLSGNIEYFFFSVIVILLNSIFFLIIFYPQFCYSKIDLYCIITNGHNIWRKEKHPLKKREIILILHIYLPFIHFLP